MISRFVWIGVGVVVAAVLGYAVWTAASPAAGGTGGLVGESVPVMADISHVEEGTDPGPYNSDPPTSGKHYARSLEPGFYETSDFEYPAGFLVHNLEHGYVIFWYDCGEFDGNCDDLKADIREVLEAERYNKVIGYPWESLEEPVVLTSWGQMLRMDEFDADAARSFVTNNRNQAPEPNAP